MIQKGSMFHKRYMSMYKQSLPSEFHNIVDEYFNCEVNIFSIKIDFNGLIHYLGHFLGSDVIQLYTVNRHYSRIFNT